MNDTNYQGGLLNSPRVAKYAALFLIFGVAFLAVEILATLHNLDYSPNATPSVITVSGEGKVSAPPTLATIYFTVSEDAATATQAQDAAAKNINAALAVLKKMNIADKDIQTSSYNVYPKYSYSQPCPMYAPAGGAYPPCVYNGSEQKIIGYTASQSVTVKIRNKDIVGQTLSNLGEAGVSNISGPNFTIENPDALQTQARTKAIADARAKATELARELGVRIVRVASYSEGGGGYPMYYKADAMGMGGATTASTPPTVPSGESEITVDVSVTYEIR